jgi:hypothetical protein
MTNHNPTIEDLTETGQTFEVPHELYRSQMVTHTIIGWYNGPFSACGTGDRMYTRYEEPMESYEPFTFYAEWAKKDDRWVPYRDTASYHPTPQTELDIVHDHFKAMTKHPTHI